MLEWSARISVWNCSWWQWRCITRVDFLPEKRPLSSFTSTAFTLWKVKSWFMKSAFLLTRSRPSCRGHSPTVREHCFSVLSIKRNFSLLKKQFGISCNTRTLPHVGSTTCFPISHAPVWLSRRGGAQGKHLATSVEFSPQTLTIISLYPQNTWYKLSNYTLAKSNLSITLKHIVSSFNYKIMYFVNIKYI